MSPQLPLRTAGLVAVVALVAASPALLPVAASNSDGAAVSIDAEGETLSVAAAERQLVTGTADAPAGTRVTVRVRSTGDGPPFLKSTQGVVREDGTWGVTFDFSGQSAGTSFEATAVLPEGNNGETSIDGEVVACEGDCADGTPAPTPTPMPTATPDGSGDGGRTPAAPPSASVDAEGETLSVAAAERQLVTGTADAPAGTGLRVMVRSTGDAEPPFIRTREAVVRGDGTWGVAFDFSGRSVGDTFSLRVATPGGTAASVDGEVVACEGDCADGTPAPAPTASPTPTATPGPASLADSVVTVRRGRTASLELSTGGAGALTVVVGGPEDGYELVATARDGNGDGRTTLYVDTAAAGSDAPTVSVPEGDSVAVGSEVDLDTRLDTGEYGVTVYRGDAASGPPDAVGTLVVEASGTVTPNGDGSSSTAPAETPDGTPATGTRPAGGTGDALPDWLPAVGAGVVFLLGGAGLAAVILRDG